MSGESPGWVMSPDTVPYVDPAFVLGDSPSYATLLTWTLADGEAVTVQGTLVITRGSGATVTRRTIEITASAKKQGVSSVAITSPALKSNGDGPMMQVQWVASGVDTVNLNLCDSAGSTAHVAFTHRVVRATP